MLLHFRCGLSLATIFLLLPIAGVCDTQRESRVKEQALALPAGSSVFVRLLNHDLLHGRMGPVTDQGFSLQYVNGGKIEERTVAFMDVRSIGRYYYISRQRTIVMLIMAMVPLGISLGFAASR